MFLTTVVFILILAVLVVAHEFGHFFAARKFGMYVEEFAVGFPPRVWSWIKNGTRFSLNLIPLGGYVKIPGENGEDETMLKKGEALIQGDKLFSKKPAWNKIAVLCAGVLMNIIVGWLLLIPVFMHGIEGGIFVAQVAKDSPAAQAGIEVGDEIIGFKTVEEFVAAVQQQAGTEMEFMINHKGEQKTVHIIPRENPPKGEGALGVALGGSGIAAVPLWQALGEATKTAWGMFKGIFILLITLAGSVVGLASGEAAQYITGPIGVFQATAQAAALGWVHVLYLAAIISLNLAAINIFPFPALDGGRILIVLIEKIKRSPVHPNTQSIINGVGFFVLMALLLWISVRDIIRIF